MDLEKPRLHSSPAVSSLRFPTESARRSVIQLGDSPQIIDALLLDKRCLRLGRLPLPAAIQPSTGYSSLIKANQAQSSSIKVKMNSPHSTTTNRPAKSFTDQPESANLQIAAAPSRRSRGKIAALPKEHRDTINKLLLDGSPYPAVINRMADQGISLNTQNLSNWYQTGFQDHLAHLERLDHQRAKYEAATDLLQNMDVSKLPEAGLQTAAAQIYDLLDKFSPDAIAAAIADQPDKYIRLVNSLSRLTREALAIKKYTDARARAALRQLDVHRKLDRDETRAIVRKVDEILGLSPDPELSTQNSKL
jgi:hypothetical protein